MRNYCFNILFCLLTQGALPALQVNPVIPKKQIAYALAAVIVRKCQLPGSPISSRTLATGPVLTMVFPELVSAGTCFLGSCLGAKQAYDFFQGQSRATKLAIKQAFEDDPVSAQKALEISQSFKISFEEARLKVFNWSQQALETASQYHVSFESAYRQLLYADAPTEIKQQMERESASLPTARDIKNNFASFVQENSQPAARTASSIKQQEDNNIKVASSSETKPHVELRAEPVSQSTPIVLHVTNNQHAALIGPEFKGINQSAIEKALSLLSPELIQESQKYIKVSTTLDTLDTKKGFINDQKIIKKTLYQEISVSDAVCQAGTAIAANLAVRAVRHAGDKLFDYFELTPEARMRKEQELLAKMRQERQEVGERFIERLTKEDQVAIDAERKFFACMLKHGKRNNKIPCACKDETLFLSEYGGSRARILLDYDGFEKAGQAQGCGGTKPVVSETLEQPVVEQSKSTVICEFPLEAKVEQHQGCGNTTIVVPDKHTGSPIKIPDRPFILEKEESQIGDKPRVSNTPDDLGKAMKDIKKEYEWDNQKQAWRLKDRGSPICSGAIYVKEDRLHNEIELYDKRGRHMGALDPLMRVIIPNSHDKIRVM